VDSASDDSSVRTDNQDYAVSRAPGCDDSSAGGTIVPRRASPPYGDPLSVCAFAPGLNHLFILHKEHRTRPVCFKGVDPALIFVDFELVVSFAQSVKGDVVSDDCRLVERTLGTRYQGFIDPDPMGRITATSPC
jgi:hypothetical protein